MISVPKLPENAPNFSSQVDFGSYQPPVVVIPDPEPETVSNLVDMSAPSSSMSSTDDSPQEPTPPTIDFEKIIRDRDDLILHLQTEVDRLA